MLQSRNFVPNIYAKSRDFQAILKILDIIINNSKVDSDTFVSLLNPETCPSKLLPLLASYVGYEYDYMLSYDINRNIINHYRDLINYRGSELGIRLAALLAVNINNPDTTIPSTSLVDINFNEINGEIEIHFYYKDYLLKIKDLLEVVRPAGIGYKILFADPYNLDSQIDINATEIEAVPTEVITSNVNTRAQINEEDESGVGFTEIDESDPEIPN